MLPAEQSLRAPARVTWLAALGAAPWLLVVRGPYQFDDVVTPVGDPASQSLGAWVSHLLHTLRPLAKLTFALEASAGLGEMPWARRVVSIAILAVGAWLLARLIAELGARAELAVALAWIWAAHPVQAECVLALAGRPMLLASVLVFAALVAAARKHRGHAAALLALAVLSRETAVAAALPVALLSLDRDRLRDLEHVAAVIVATAAWLLVQPRYRQLADYSIHGRPWLASFVAQVAAVPIGQSLYVRPWALSVDHGEALPTSPDASFWIGIALYLAFAALAFYGWRARRPALAVGAALWLAAILPTQSVVPKLDALTERPLPLALAALAILAGGLLPRTRAPALVGGATLLALAASVATYARGALYASEEALWRDAAHKSVTNARPYYNLAKVLDEEGRTGEALEAARAAARIDPYDSRAAALVELLRARLDSPE